MNLHDYIQDNQEFWKDVDRMGLVSTFNKWFLFDDKFATLAVEYMEGLSMSKPQGNWDEYSKAYVETYLYDPDYKVDEEPPENNSKDDDDFNPDEIELPF